MRLQLAMTPAMGSPSSHPAWRCLLGRIFAVRLVPEVRLAEKWHQFAVKATSRWQPIPTMRTAPKRVRVRHILQEVRGHGRKAVRLVIARSFLVKRVSVIPTFSFLSLMSDFGAVDRT